MMDDENTSNLGLKVTIHTQISSSDDDEDDDDDDIASKPSSNKSLSELKNKEKKKTKDSDNEKRPYTGSKSQSFKLSHSADQEIQESLVSVRTTCS